MKVAIKRLDGKAVFETDAESLARAVELAVEHGVDLYGANLRDANLRGAYLRGANLRRADMRGASLHGADMRCASLRCASLHGASLHGADMRGADMRGANSIISLGPCDGWWVYAVRHAEGPRFGVGCHWFTLPEARAYWAGKTSRAQVLRAVDWIATEAAARGWEMPSEDCPERRMRDADDPDA